MMLAVPFSRQGRFAADYRGSDLRRAARDRVAPDRGGPRAKRRGTAILDDSCAPSAGNHLFMRLLTLLPRPR